MRRILISRRCLRCFVLSHKLLLTLSCEAQTRETLLGFQYSALVTGHVSVSDGCGAQAALLLSRGHFWWTLCNKVSMMTEERRGRGHVFDDMLSLSHNPQIMVECAGVTLCWLNDHEVLTEIWSGKFFCSGSYNKRFGTTQQCLFI